VGESPSPDLRIGDLEREEALRVLGEHTSVGRLDVDEYGERAARASAAKTRGELTQLFVDLPQPHPQLDRLPTPQAAAAPAGQPPESGRPPRGDWDQRPLAQRISGALVPLSGILSIVLFFSVPGMNWVIFLLPAAIAVITGAMWGEDQRKHKSKVKYKYKE
jgi:hypothetical protein